MERTLGYYKSTAGSYGLQRGSRDSATRCFSSTDSLLRGCTEGWLGIGSAPSVVVVNRGKSGSLSTTNFTKRIYTFFFNQKGLMGGLGLQGSKITSFDP
jgi:lipid-binding SYLF domain-containing protein